METRLPGPWADATEMGIGCGKPVRHSATAAVVKLEVRLVSLFVEMDGPCAGISIELMSSHPEVGAERAIGDALPSDEEGDIGIFGQHRLTVCKRTSRPTQPAQTARSGTEDLAQTRKFSSCIHSVIASTSLRQAPG